MAKTNAGSAKVYIERQMARFREEFLNPILDGGGQICPPPAGFLNIAQKPLGLGS